MRTPRRIIHIPDIDRFSLEREGRRVGFLSYTLERRKTMLIDVIEVEPDIEIDQIRGELMMAAVDWAREHGFLVLAQCPRARALLEALPAA